MHDWGLGTPSSRTRGDAGGARPHGEARPRGDGPRSDPGDDAPSDGDPGGGRRSRDRDGGRRHGGRARRTPARRGNANLIGVVLLVGFTAAVAFLVAAGGMTAVDGGRDRASLAHAEDELLVVDDLADEVALGPADGGTVTVGTAGEGRFRVRERGRITVTVGDETVLDRTLGAVEYRTGDGVVAYQGGGVWRGVGPGARPVSTPRIDYRNGTLTLGIVTLSGTAAPGGGPVGLTADGRRTLRSDLAPAPTLVTVRSRYYAGWAEFFRSSVPGASVIVDDADRTVTVLFGGTTAPGTFSAALTSWDGGIEISTGYSRVEGPLSTDHGTTLGPAAEHQGPTIGAPNPEPLPVDALVEAKVRYAKASGADLGSVEGSETLGDGGVYYVGGDLTLENGDSLTVDLSEGNVTLAVEGDVDISGGTVHVVGTGGGGVADQDTALRVFSTGNLAMKNGRAYVGTTDDTDARHLQVYGTSGMQVGMSGGNTYFEGVVYAPRTEQVPGPNTAFDTAGIQCSVLETVGAADTCIATGNTAVEGAIYGGPAAVKQSTTVEWDPKLDDRPLRVSARDPVGTPLRRLHVPVGGVVFEDS